MATFCPRCNTANRDGSRFCNTCGAQLLTPALTACPNCQKPVVVHSAFCHQCGAALPQPIVEAVAPPAPITEEDSTSAPTGESEIISLDQVPEVDGGIVSAASGDQLADDMTGPVAGDSLHDLSDEADESPSAAPTLAQPPTPDVALSDSPAPTPAEAARLRRSRTASAAVAPPVATPLLRVHRSPGQPVPPTPPAPPARQGDGAQWWRRLAHLLLAAAVIGGLMLPRGWFGAAQPAAAEVANLYHTIQGLSPQSVVLFSFDYDPSSADEMRPLAEALLRHVMQQRARFLVMSLHPQGPALAQAIVAPLAEQSGYVYGFDYVNLGYLSGDDAALAALGDRLTEAFVTDFVYGLPLATFEVAAGAPSVDAIALVIDITADDATLRRWVEQVQARRQVVLAGAASAVAMPLTFAYLQSGQVTGLLGGLPAAAQYERLIGVEGLATRGLEAQTSGHIAILLFVAIANLRLIFRRP